MTFAGHNQVQRTEQQMRFAKAVFPKLEALADDVERLAERMMSQPFSYDQEENSDFMTLSFVAKQREHFQSVRLLVSHGQHRDALLIARTMIEGVAALLWANHKPKDQNDRTELWRTFIVISNWRALRDSERDGTDIPQSKIDFFKELIEEHGHKYLRRDVVKKKSEKEAAGEEYRMPTDPWRYEWADVSAFQMLQAVGGEALYRSAYRDASDWAHWGPRFISIAVEDSTKSGTWGDKKLTAEDPRAAVWALQLGVLSVLQSLGALNLYFSLEQTEGVESLFEQMYQIGAEGKAAAG